MLAALIAGQRDPQILAQYARGRLRGKLADLEEAFTGRFNDHHGFLLSKMLARVDQVDADLTDLDARIEAELGPFAQAPARLDEIPGVGHDTACVIISEIGIDMSRFPTAAHLCSWASVRARSQGIRRTTKGQRNHRAPSEDEVGRVPKRDLRRSGAKANYSPRERKARRVHTHRPRRALLQCGRPCRDR